MPKPKAVASFDELRKRIVLLEETLLSHQRLVHTQRELLEAQTAEIASLKREIELLKKTD